MNIKRKEPGIGLTKLIVPAAVATALCGAAGTAAAAEPGFYMTVDVALTDYDLSSAGTDEELEALLEDEGYTVVDAETSLDKSAVGYGLGFGYQFNSNFAVEASYFDDGSASYSASATVDGGEGPVDAEADIDIKSRGPTLSLLASWPVSENFSLDARLGAFFSKTKVEADAVIDGVEMDDLLSGSESDTGILYGVGGTWSLSPTTAVRFGYTFGKDAVGGVEDVNYFSIGIRWGFGS
jgi:OOP family OmpA-OmpF porin